MNDRGTLVSIVTPVLNQARFLRATIESVRGQSYTNFEHIVIDGGSTDGTIELLESYAGTYPLRWHTGSDRGMYDGINKGLALAEGEILTYLNSDDLLMPWSLAAVVETFARHPNYDLVFGDALRLYEELEAWDLMLQIPFRDSILGRTGSFIQPAVFWRRGLVESIGSFDAELRLSADLDYWLRASRAGVFGQIEEVLAIERAHAGGQTARLTTALRREATEVRARYHPDRRLRLVRKVAARVLLELAVRWQMWKFAWSLARNGSGWRHFRRATNPRLNVRWFVAAMITPRPLVGTQTRSFAMRLLRGRWLRFDPRSVLIPPSQD